MRARHAPPPLGSIVFTVPALQWVRVILAHRVPGETIDMAQDPLLLPESARVDEAAPLPERRPEGKPPQQPRQAKPVRQPWEPRPPRSPDRDREDRGPSPVGLGDHVPAFLKKTTRTAN